MGNRGFHIKRPVDGMQIWHGQILEFAIEFDVAIDCFKLVEGE